jgi:cysteinyl-tRNA synthetase
MDLTWDSLKAADSTIERWRVKHAQWKSDGEIDKQFVAEFSKGSLADIQRDLDTPRAIQQLRKLEKDDLLSGATKAECFQVMDSIFALDITRAPKVKAEASEKILELLAKRSSARASKDFALSDKLRDELSKLGVGVKDSPTGQEWDWL